MHYRLLTLLALLLALPYKHWAQHSDSRYITPMDIPIVLSGNFGEMRKNHFHTGIDIKTQGRQGIPLLSIADGHISRIKVSPYGYGNALYIDHPDGNTSVYAHMKSFNDTIAAYIKKKQYEQETWAIECYPETGELSVRQGEVIGLSGNSGSSSGPHLHFEIRETETEHPVNPQSYGIEAKDALAPLMKGIRLYPLDSYSHVAGGADSKSYPLKSTGSNSYRPDGKLKANGSVGVGIHSYDVMTGTNNKYGLYRLEMYVDGNLHYAHTMDELDFDNFRQVNCHKDYDLYHSNKWRYHKCFLAENNTLEIYDTLIDQGRLWLADGDTMDLRVVAYDIQGNSAELNCLVYGTAEIVEPWPSPEGILLPANQDNIYLDSGLVVRIPHGRLYEDLYIHPSRSERKEGISYKYTLHDCDVPLDDKIAISIRSEIDSSEVPHIVMEHKDSMGRARYLAANESQGWYEVSHKYLGSYRLVEDATAPIVTISGLATKGKKEKVTLSMSDNRSGVAMFRVSIDGQWLMMANNAGMSRAWGYLSDLSLSSGNHTIQVVAIDLAGNEKRLEKVFSY